MTIQMKATEQYFPVVLFIILHKVIQTYESVDEIVKSVIIQVEASEVYFHVTQFVLQNFVKRM